MSCGTIFLFDIDGTIISTNGAARRALEIAVAEFLELPSFKANFNFGGMTDRVILEQSLEQYALEKKIVFPRSSFSELMKHYLNVLERVMNEASSVIVHPGILAALNSIKRHSNCALGLGTGNVEIGARIKLRRVQLNAYFNFGGYGSDSHLRPSLISTGIRRGAASLRCNTADCTSIIIGDTVRDIEAAHANNAIAIAVGTGNVPLSTLKKAGADHVFHTLADEGALETILKYCSSSSR